MSHTLLLNANYEPISILPLSVINWQHSIKLYFLDRITILESYDDWVIHSEKLAINVPSVCVTPAPVVARSAMMLESALTVVLRLKERPVSFLKSKKPPCKSSAAAPVPSAPAFEVATSVRKPLFTVTVPVKVFA